MDIWHLIPPYHLWGWQEYMFHAMWGLVGALVRIAYRNSAIRMPTRSDDGTIRLNALGNMFVGVVVGMLVDTGPLAAVVGAVIAPELIETVSGILTEGIRANLRRWLGLSND